MWFVNQSHALRYIAMNNGNKTTTLKINLMSLSCSLEQNFDLGICRSLLHELYCFTYSLGLLSISKKYALVQGFLPSHFVCNENVPKATEPRSGH